MQQANIINIITNKYEPQQKHRLGTVSKKKITGGLLKREAKLLTVIGLNTKHADCRIIFMLYLCRSTLEKRKL